ncbi:MAG: S8 family serine peptidase, partial [Bacteroidota bacterium]
MKIKSFFSYLVSGFILFLISLNISYSIDFSKVLSPDKKLNRTGKVLANTIKVRFKQNTDISKSKKKSADNNLISNFIPVLPAELSISKSSDLSKKKNIDIKNILAIQKAEEPLNRTFYVDFNGNTSPEQFCKKLLKVYPEIEIAEPYYLDELLGIPNDPLAPQQLTLLNIHLFEAWDYNGFLGDTSVIIGISDIGMYQEHEDLSGSIAKNWKEIPNNDIDDDGNGYVDDFNGYNFTYEQDKTSEDYTFHGNEHGTIAAGIAGATYNNLKGITGTGGKCRLFPIKCGARNEESISYGYQSFIYAAARGCKVLNASWGREKLFSEIDQSFIDYAVANDVAIVIAGGNGNGSTNPYYPAGYRGVLGVGEVDPNDYVTSGTSLGSHVLIMAPGDGNYYTTNGNNYGHYEQGTSFAAPIVAGVVGLVRAKYPELTAIQSLEFVRQCTDDISGLNPRVSQIIPGRINAEKAAKTDPFSIPAIKPVNLVFRTNTGIITNRFGVADTINLSINAHNYLGAASNLKFTLSTAKDPMNTILILDSVVNIVSVGKDENLTLEPFQFYVASQNTNRIFFRVDIAGENGYHDFFHVPFTPTTEVATFENETIKVSFGDRGTFGFGGTYGNQLGEGFSYKNYGNQLFPSCGLFATENAVNLASSAYGYGPDNNDFKVIKPFIEPERNKNSIEE